MPMIKGKIEKLNKRTGTKGDFWYATIDKVEYYCGDAWIADKEGLIVEMEVYNTKSGKAAVRPLNSAPPAEKEPAPAGGKKEWVPRYRDTEEYDKLDKAFTCRTMSMSYAKDIVGRAYEGVPRPAPGEGMTHLVKCMTLDTLRVYMALHDTIAMGTDLPGSEAIFLGTKVGGSPNIKAESGALDNPPAPSLASADQRKEIVELASQLGAVPVRVSKQYIGRAIKNMNDITAVEADSFIAKLKDEIAKSDVPF